MDKRCIGIGKFFCLALNFMFSQYNTDRLYKNSFASVLFDGDILC